MDDMPWIVRKVRHRLYRKNKNWLCAICGPTGSGKSYSALQLAVQIDPSFTIERCVFRAERFLEILNSGTLKRGHAIVFDEAGVGLPAREWWKISNKALNYVLQTFRRENLAVIITTPSLGFLDKQARVLIHTFIETMKVEKDKKRVRVKVKESQTNPQMGKTYYKYYRKGRGVLKMTYVTKPPKWLIKDYERKKREFAQALYKEAMDDVKAIKVKAAPKISVNKIVDEIIKNPEPFLMWWQGRQVISRPMIAQKFRVGETYVRRSKDMAERQLKLGRYSS